MSNKHQARTMVNSGSVHYAVVDKSTIECDSKNKNDFVSKRGVSIPALYKPTHNKSESGLKQKSCSVNKNNVRKIKDSSGISPIITEHLIKTY